MTYSLSEVIQQKRRECLGRPPGDTGDTVVAGGCLYYFLPCATPRSSQKVFLEFPFEDWDDREVCARAAYVFKPPDVMTSLIAEILMPKEPLERANIKAIVSKLSRTIDDLKVDVQKELVSRYDIFQPYYHDSKHLAVCLDSALKEVDCVLKDVQDLVKPRLAQTTSEFELLSRELESLEQQSVEVEKIRRACMTCWRAPRRSSSRKTC
uniref:Putative centromere/kinetochore protein zw10 n=1 Tax=Ixodes ricinus TaxID=34613 RepID=A0A0K8R812_IXORI